MRTQEQEHDSSLGCLLHLFWLFLGNFVLIVLAGELLLFPSGWFSGLDAVYWFVVALIVAARYADIRYFQGATAEGKPSTFEHWRRHAFILVLSASVVWLAVHVLGAFWFSH
jgi:hypothetical protein